jgi:hypothetical protein
MLARWLAAAALLVSACGDNAPFGVIGFVELGDLYAKQKLAFCRRATACGLIDDPRTCLVSNTGLRDIVDPNLLAAAADGSVTYDGAAAGRCLEASALRTCDVTDEDGRAPDEDCLLALRGTVDEGGACAIDAQCKSQRCELAACPEACCAGTCIGPPVDPRPIGFSSTCSSSSECVSGSYCAASGTCETLLAAGTQCASASECAYGLGCAGSPRVCKPLPALGEPCPDRQCRDEGTYCELSTQTCAPLGLDGDPCTASDACSPFFSCDRVQQRCRRGAAVGEPCASTLQCASAATYCDVGTGSCTARKPEGQACERDDECTSASCLGTCASPVVCI